ncbi:MAG TPA: hypothetical protein VHT02_09480 [Methylocella sp.]|jgi:hypothetical protein|nr:hypothetical protein [Methylocella sp.]
MILSRRAAEAIAAAKEMAVKPASVISYVLPALIILSNQNAALSRGRPATMPYAAVIHAEPSHAPGGLLEDIAPFFASAIATIRRRENEWILESSSFEPYESDEKLYQAANHLVAQIHRVLALYLRLYGEPFTVRALLRLTDDDRLIARRRYATFKVSVSLPAGQVFSSTASGSLGTVVLSRAATDPAIAEAPSLLGHEAPTWGKIYDIIEFLGGRVP